MNPLSRHSGAGRNPVCQKSRVADNALFHFAKYFFELSKASLLPANPDSIFWIAAPYRVRGRFFAGMPQFLLKDFLE